jgi:AcrR family transcriptional regulator
MTRAWIDTGTRREQIAQAALGLIAERGLRGLRAGPLARRAGLVPSGLYRHFESLDGVVDAVLDLIRDRLVANVEAACAGVDDPLERLHRVLGLHARLIREHHALPRIIFSDEVFGGDAARRARLRGILHDYVARIESILRDGQAAGAIRSDAGARTLAVMFLGLLQPAAILAALSEGAFDAVRHAEAAWAVYADALRPRPRRKGAG